MVGTHIKFLMSSMKTKKLRVKVFSLRKEEDHCTCSMWLFSINDGVMIFCVRLNSIYLLHLSPNAVFFPCKNEILITQYLVIFNFKDGTGRVQNLGTGGYRDPVRACSQVAPTDLYSWKNVMSHTGAPTELYWWKNIVTHGWPQLSYWWKKCYVTHGAPQLTL